MSLTEPSKISTPWAESGLRVEIPDVANNTTGKAGFDKGFPESTMLSKASGGIPPSGMDFNGIFYEITSILRYIQAGGLPTFSGDFAAEIGGYPDGAMLIGDDKLSIYQNSIDGNTSNPNTGGAGWVDVSNGALRTELAEDGGAQLVKNAVRWFDSVQSMLLAEDLVTGQKVSTGASAFKIITGTKGLPLSNGTQYALPLNGVWIDDAGADPTGVADSYAALMYVTDLFNANTRRKFAVKSDGGVYNISAEWALHSLTSDIKISLGGANINATADMATLFSCPAISGIRFFGVKVSHSPGVTISGAMAVFNNSPGSSKITRVIVDDITAGLVTGAPQVLLFDRMWESEIRRLRYDVDVAGHTGRAVYFRSCVNVAVGPSEVGYAAEGYNLGKNPDVSYGCEGITFNGGVITECNVPVVGNYATAVRFIGTVMDFCNNSGPTFTNGQDVSLSGCWIANKSTSAAGWNGVTSQASFSKLKVEGCHFVNNSASSCNCASIMSPDSSFIGNTASSLMLPGARASDVREMGNSYTQKGVANFKERGSSFSFAGEAGIAPALSLGSGLTSAVSGTLLSRVNLEAKGVNSSNVFNIDHIRGFAADIPRMRFGHNGDNGWDFNPADWHMTCLKPGAGVRLTSPDGLTTKVLRLSNAGALELI